MESCLGGLLAVARFGILQHSSSPIGVVVRQEMRSRRMAVLIVCYRTNSGAAGISRQPAAGFGAD